MKKYILGIILILIGAGKGLAAPLPVSLSGSIVNGQPITITGSSFGSGPNVTLFDQFNGGPAGTDIPLTSPDVGAWTKYASGSGYYPQFSSDYHSPPFSDAWYIRNNTGILQDAFLPGGQGVTEIYISFWFKVPSGTYFPWRVQASDAIVPADDHSFGYPINWKMTWLFRNDTPEVNPPDNQYDLVSPTILNAGSLSAQAFYAADNVYYPTVSGGYRGLDFVNWFKFGTWNRLSEWLKADPTNPITAPGTIYTQGFAEGYQNMVQIQNNPTSFFNMTLGRTGATPVGWNELQFPGFLDSNIPNVNPLYDDIYMATGPNAAARIEIGDNSVYADCTNLAILIPTSWTDNSVTAVVKLGSFQPGQTAHVFITDSNNNTVVVPGSYTIGSSGEDTTGPFMSNGLPSSPLTSGTTSATLSVDANDVSTVTGCKYDTIDRDYASMANTLSNTSGITWSATISGLTDGIDIPHYVRCVDSLGNADTSSTVIRVQVNSPETPHPTANARSFLGGKSKLGSGKMILQ